MQKYTKRTSRPKLREPSNLEPSHKRKSTKKEALRIAAASLNLQLKTIAYYLRTAGTFLASADFHQKK